VALRKPDAVHEWAFFRNPMTDLEVIKEAYDRIGIGYTEFVWKIENKGMPEYGQKMTCIIPGRYKLPKNKRSRERFFDTLIETDTCLEFNQDGKFTGH
jgi:hypothetical protein